MKKEISAKQPLRRRVRCSIVLFKFDPQRILSFANLFSKDFTVSSLMSGKTNRLAIFDSFLLAASNIVC